MLVLSSNLADPAGVEGSFTTGLAKNKSLKSLCLAACRLQNKGPTALSLFFYGCGEAWGSCAQGRWPATPRP